MRLEPVDSPPLFPECVSSYSARMSGNQRLHFEAGRECAARAMARLGIAPAVVERGAAGEPVWPRGITGSITHKRDYVSAAVGRTADVLSVGIDVEELMNDTQAERIARVVVLPQEAEVGGADLSMALRVSLIFSIKEALFKCLYPLAQRRFYYDAAAVRELDLHAGRFGAVLLTDLPHGLHRGRELTGRCLVDPPRVHAGVWLGLPAE